MNVLFRRWMRVLLCVAPLMYIASQAVNQTRFERFLKSLFITFNDFDPADAQALVDPAHKDLTSKPPIDTEFTIPPKIHFIWFKDLYDTDISHQGSQAPAICHEHNPAFDIHVWNASEARTLLEEHFAWFLPTYDGYQHPIQRVDAFKYFVLLHHGGIYMDLDISCRRSLTPLLSFPAWFPEASPLGVNNDLMASRAGHPALKLMTERLQSRNKNLLFPYLTIFWTTGPQFTSDVLHMWWNQYPGGYYEKGSKKDTNPGWFYVLPREFYSEQYSFFGHSPGGTWHGTDVAAVLWLVQRPWLLMFAGAALVLPCLVMWYRRRKYRRAARLDAEFGEGYPLH